MNPNPYAPPTTHNNWNGTWIPKVVCAVTTFVAIPICFAARIQLETMAGTDINNPAVIAYLVIVAALMLPITLITSFLFAPIFHKLTNSKIRMLNGLIGIALLAFTWIMFDLYFPALMNSVFPKFDGWLMYYYLVSFMGLPTIIGMGFYLLFAPLGLPKTEIGR